MMTIVWGQADGFVLQSWAPHLVEGFGLKRPIVRLSELSFLRRVASHLPLPPLSTVSSCSARVASLPQNQPQALSVPYWHQDGFIALYCSMWPHPISPHCVISWIYFDSIILFRFWWFISSFGQKVLKTLVFIFGICLAFHNLLAVTQIYKISSSLHFFISIA